MPEMLMLSSPYTPGLSEEDVCKLLFFVRTSECDVLELSCRLRATLIHFDPELVLDQLEESLMDNNNDNSGSETDSDEEEDSGHEQEGSEPHFRFLEVEFEEGESEADNSDYEPSDDASDDAQKDNAGPALFKIHYEDDSEVDDSDYNPDKESDLDYSESSSDSDHLEELDGPLREHILYNVLEAMSNFTALGFYEWFDEAPVPVIQDIIEIVGGTDEFSEWVLDGGSPQATATSFAKVNPLPKA